MSCQPVCLPTRNNIYTRADLKRHDPYAITDTAEWSPNGDHVTYTRLEPADPASTRWGWRFIAVGAGIVGYGCIFTATNLEAALVGVMGACIGAVGLALLANGKASRSSHTIGQEGARGTAPTYGEHEQQYGTRQSYAAQNDDASNQHRLPAYNRHESGDCRSITEQMNEPQDEDVPEAFRDFFADRRW